MGVRKLLYFSVVLTLFCVTLLSPKFAPADDLSANTFTLDANTRHLVINHIDYLVETFQPLEYRQVAGKKFAGQWKTLSDKRFNFGDFHTPVWFRFDLVDNPHDANHNWLLEISQQMLDHIEVYTYNHDTQQWSPKQMAGNLVPLSLWPMKHPHPVFPIQLSPGQKTSVYIRVKSTLQLNLTIDVWQLSAFRQHDHFHTLILGLFFGILVIMILYNSVIFFFSKDINYLIYVIYVLAVVFYELTITGIGGCYLWPESIWLKDVSFRLFSSLCFLSGAIFIRYFLNLKSYGGWVLHLNNIFLVCWIIFPQSCFIPPHPILYPIILMTALVSPMASTVTSCYLWYKGNVQAKYYTIAYSFTNVGTVILMLGYSGIMQRSWLTEYSQMIGFVFELTLLALALADRINRERLARENAQQTALEQSKKAARAHEEKLMIQEQILDLQRQTNEQLELRVLERTNELERAMRNLELANKELSQLSYTDPLTKTYNRRYFEEILANEIKRASRTQHPLSVALVNIDHFKLINDSHGHLVGDQCLHLVAKTLKAQLCRTSDLIARVAGEEFAFILPATSQENSLVVANRAREAVLDIDFVHRGQRIGLSVSIGVAGWIPDLGETNQKLIEAADMALYHAKKNGRNKALVAGEA